MKKHLLFLLLITSFLSARSQQADNWYFGILAGLNFSTSPPTVLTDGKLATPEGCASISDSNGDLLFYTDGITVWNKEHDPMPNGTGLLAGSSSTQATLIAPLPGSGTIHYVFTVDEIGGPNGFRYSIVDMSLDGGLGDVVEKNILVQNDVTEKLTAITTFDGSKTWVLVHEWGSNAFYTYELTSSGFNTAAPVISNAGTVHNTSVIQNTYGQMKFTSLGCHLAVAIGYQDIVELFDFDMFTGEVSDAVSIPFTNHVYGVEFSPDDSKLYVTCYNPSGTLVQFDLLGGSADAIIASATTISTNEDLYGLQLGPDGQIYIAKSYQPYLAIITDPNASGTDCALELNGIYLDPAYMGVTGSLGLPNFVQSYFDVNHKGCNTFTAVDESADETTVAYPNPADNYIIFNNTDISAGAIHITLHDVTGRALREFDIPGSQSETRLDVSMLTGGWYTIQATHGDQSTLKKILILRN